MRLACRVIPWIVIIIVSVLVARHPLIGVFDSVVNWAAVQIFLDGGNPYDFEALVKRLTTIMRDVPEFQRVSGHPWTLTFVIPLNMWPFPMAKFLLALTTLSIYHICLKRLGRLWPALPRYSSALMWAYIPLLVCIFFGQLSAFLLLGAVLMLEWLQSARRPWWKWAIAFALFSLKPQGFIVLAPFLVIEFLRTSNWRGRFYACVLLAAVGALSLPMLRYTPEWLVSNGFSYLHRSATLSVYARDAAISMGIDSPLTLWVLPVASLLALLATRFRVSDALSFLLVLLLSQLSAPYIWVYDSCALMPLLYAMIGAFVVMGDLRWRRNLGALFAVVAVSPVYLALNPDFHFMRMHNVALALASLLLLPGLRRYLPSATIASPRTSP